MLDPGTGKPSLYCETTFTERADVELVAVVTDETCASGALLVQVVGTTETVWRVRDTYAGPAPLGKFAVAGNEAPLSETWWSRTATELGCA